VLGRHQESTPRSSKARAAQFPLLKCRYRTYYDGTRSSSLSSRSAYSQPNRCAVALTLWGDRSAHDPVKRGIFVRPTMGWISSVLKYRFIRTNKLELAASVVTESTRPAHALGAYRAGWWSLTVRDRPCREEGLKIVRLGCLTNAKGSGVDHHLHRSPIERQHPQAISRFIFAMSLAQCITEFGPGRVIEEVSLSNQPACMKVRFTPGNLRHS